MQKLEIGKVEVRNRGRNWKQKVEAVIANLEIGNTKVKKCKLENVKGRTWRL